MSTQLKDGQGNIIDQLDSLGGQTLTDNRANVLTLAAVNAETVLFCKNTNSVAIEVRNTFVGTMVVQYSIDGTNYDQAPIFNPITELFIVNISTVGKYVCHLPSGTKQVRVLMNAYTSGSAFVSLRGSEGDNFIYAKPIPTTSSITSTAALSAALTNTVSAAGLGLFHYITRIRISKYCGAALTAAAAPSIVTTTNLATTPSFDFKTLGAQGDSEILDLQFTGNPLKSTTANTATTFVCPVLTGAIWKVTVFYYVGA
jgi:hypothetical protein